jgi:hypothetical protein
MHCNAVFRVQAITRWFASCSNLARNVHPFTLPLQVPSIGPKQSSFRQAIKHTTTIMLERLVGSTKPATLSSLFEQLSAMSQPDAKY